MFNLDGFVKLTVNDVVWCIDQNGEPCWKPKNPEPGKNYCLMIPKVDNCAFSGKPFLESLHKSGESQNH